MAGVDELFDAAMAAWGQAYAPHSNFAVGAAIRAKSGRVYAGCNIENQSYPEGWCAETTAIGHMVMAGEREIVEVLVVADRLPPVTPCGGCRQRLLEFGRPDTVVHAATPDGPQAKWTLEELLPAAFSLERKG